MEPVAVALDDVAAPEGEVLDDVAGLRDQLVLGLGLDRLRDPRGIALLIALNVGEGRAAAAGQRRRSGPRRGEAAGGGARGRGKPRLGRGERTPAAPGAASRR